MKYLIISKELLAEVMEFKKQNKLPSDLDFIRQNNNEIEFGFILKNNENVQYVFHINMHELAHKCKEWAFANGYSIMSWQNAKDTYFADIRENGNMIVECKKEDSETEVIFKASQYILNLCNKLKRVKRNGTHQL